MSFTRSLTYDSSHIVPDGELVSFCFFPSKVVTEVEGQPEEEWVIHQFQAGIGQRILEQRAGQKTVSTWEIQAVFLLLPIKLYTQTKLSEGSASAFHLRRQRYESLMLNIKGNPGIQKSLSRRLFSFHWMQWVKMLPMQSWEELTPGFKNKNQKPHNKKFNSPSKEKGANRMTWNKPEI